MSRRLLDWSIWSGLRLVVSFLTRLPVSLPQPPQPHELAASLRWYPLVGAGIGIGLGLACLLLSAWQAPPWPAAVLVLALWVWATGALHLDGLADSADAWGACAPRERMLVLMRDPHVGTHAVVVVVLVLLGKFAALATLLQAPAPKLLALQQPALWPAWLAWAGSWLATLMLPTMLARTGAVALLLGTPAARDEGLGASLASAVNTAMARRQVLVVLGAMALVALLLPHGWLALLVTLLTIWLGRRTMMRRLGGLTGDTVGAAIELSECFTLLALALATNQAGR